MVKPNKDWMSAVIIGLLIVTILFLFHMKGKISEVQAKCDKIAEVLASTEGVVLGVDGSTQDILKGLQNVESNVKYLVKKRRRR